jgi:hypothetical protein
MTDPRSQQPTAPQPGSHDELIKEWREQTRETFILWSIATGITGLISAALFIWNSYATEEVNGVIIAGSKGLKIFGALFLFGAVVCSIRMLVDGVKLISGPPKTGAKSAAEAVALFYKRLELDSGIKVSAMFLLDKCAIEDIGGWKGFSSHWRSVRDIILTNLPFDKFDFDCSFEDVLYNVSTGPTVADSAGKKRIKSTLSFYRSYRKKPLIASRDPNYKGQLIFGNLRTDYFVENEVVEVDDRWYLTSARWNGKRQ